jgi:hypothetical protein
VALFTIYLFVFLQTLLFHFLSATSVSVVVYHLEPITVISATFGCQTKRPRTTVLIADFAEWVELKTFNIATSAACALTKVCMITIIARLVNTEAIVQCVRSIYLAQEVRHTKCPVGMLFIGIVFGNLRRMIVDVLCVKRRRKPENACYRLGMPWQWAWLSSLYLPICAEWLISAATIASNNS